jgi:hypothetical protein
VRCAAVFAVIAVGAIVLILIKYRQSAHAHIGHVYQRVFKDGALTHAQAAL